MGFLTPGWHWSVHSRTGTYLTLLRLAGRVATLGLTGLCVDFTSEWWTTSGCQARDRAATRAVDAVLPAGECADHHRAGDGGMERWWPAAAAWLRWWTTVDGIPGESEDEAALRPARAGPG